MRPIDVSIVILARNEAPHLAVSLPIIRDQKTALSFEVLGIDTESEDETVALFQRYGARTISIARSEFHHVRTRMLGVKESRGTYIVFLVGDAIPYTENWLENLVKPLLQDTSVAASYSRQLPKPGCYPWEARDICAGGSPVRRVKSVDFADPFQAQNYRNHTWDFIMFSDVSSCYRRDLLERFPFNETLPEVEDQEWCKRAIEQGYAVVFEPTSVVIHSHNDTWRRLFRRNFIYGQAFASFLELRPDPIKKVIFRAAYDTAADTFYIAGAPASVGRKLGWMLRSPIVRLIKRWAFNQGVKSKTGGGSAG